MASVETAVPSDKDLKSIAEARALSTIQPVAAQLPYSLAFRAIVEDPAMVDAMGPMGVVASAVLAGGALTGKYADGGDGRLSGRLDDPRFATAFAEAERALDRARPPERPALRSSL